MASPSGGGGAKEDPKKTLFKAAMQGKWEEVVSIYTNNTSIQALKITRSEDTVLHIAVSEGKKEIVKQLINAVAKGNEQPILEQKNEKGNTPLHLAAALGMVEVCAAMAKKCPALVSDARNNRKETPLFLAAKYGKKHTFFVLQYTIESMSNGPLRQNPTDISYCRRDGGNTILHVAINAEHFELAWEIIHLPDYKQLVDFNNEMGETALHCLANKPDVFRSASRFGLVDNLIYYCTFVNPMVVKYSSSKGKDYFDSVKPKDGSEKLPVNYKTCVDVCGLLKRIYMMLFSSFKDRSLNKCYIADEEDPGSVQREQQNQETYDSSNQHVNGSSTQGLFPKNYETCFDIFKVAMKFLLVVLGIGLWRTQEVQKKKRKHIYACQIMNELVSRSSKWEYDEDGKKPENKPALAGEISLPKDTPPIDDDSQLNSSKNSSTTEQPSTSAEQIQEEPSMNGTKNGSNEKRKQDVDSKNDSTGTDKAAGSIKEPDGVTPILVAAKRGVTEIVEKILDNFPVAVQDMDPNDKNIVLLAVEHRQPNVYQLMLKRNIMKESVFGRVDKEGNSALHLAATLGNSRPWIIPGAALQMQWEIKWYKFVMKSMDPDFFPQYNTAGETAREVFTKKHDQLVKDGGSWLGNTSQSCSVVAALIATVAFASATSVPGGVNDQSGIPTLEGKPAFQIFALSALVALCFSVTSLIMFLAILTSRYQELDFENDLPVKLIFGLTSLFMSIASMLVSFCAGHFFVVEKKLKYVTYPIYAVMCLPVTFFAVAQFPLYVDLIRATFARVPERTEKMQDF